jgi:hypothetical protein
LPNPDAESLYLSLYLSLYFNALLAKREKMVKDGWSEILSIQYDENSSPHLAPFLEGIL